MQFCTKVLSFDHFCKFLSANFVMIYMTLCSDMTGCRQLFDQPCMIKIDVFIAHRSMTGTASAKRQTQMQSSQGVGCQQGTTVLVLLLLCCKGPD